MITEPVPDESVVAQVRAGDRDRFELLMRRHNTRVYRAVRGLLRDEAEVEDVMQQAYFRAFLHLDQLSEGAKVSAWLVRIAVNEAMSRLRQRRRLAEDGLEEDGEDMASPRNTPETDAGAQELGALLQDAVGRLREIYRVVFIMRDIEGMSTAEVAEALSVSEQVVKTRLHRARDLLRRQLLARTGKAMADVFAFPAPRCDRVVAAVLRRIRNQS